MMRHNPTISKVHLLQWNEWTYSTRLPSGSRQYTLSSFSTAPVLSTTSPPSSIFQRNKKVSQRNLDQLVSITPIAPNSSGGGEAACV